MYSNTSLGSEILSGSNTCDGQMIQKLNKIQLSINNINISGKGKERNWYYNVLLQQTYDIGNCAWIYCKTSLELMMLI